MRSQPLHPDSQEYTAFITQYGLFEWNRVAMGLKGSGPFFQRSMTNKVLAGYVTHICDIYIDELAKKKATRAAKAETDSLLAEAQASSQKATAKLGSIQRQHKEQCEELMEEKSGLLVGLEDE